MKQDLVNGSFVAIVGNIYQQGVAATLPWLIAMTLVVLVDYVTALRRCYLTGEPIRFSRGMRATMSKLVCYWALCVGAVMVSVASGEMAIAKWSCLFVCAIEACSIVSNIIKPHGYSVSINGILRVIGSKFGVDHLDETVKKTKKK